MYLADRLLLLTGRPTTIAASLDVLIGWPRLPSVLSDPAFVAIKAHALSVFRASIAA